MSSAVKKVEAGEIAVIKQEAVPASITSDTAAMLSMIERIMTDPNIPVERINQAFDFYKRLDEAQAKKAFNAALAAARAEIPPIIKNREVDFTSTKGRTNYRYEDLAGIAKVIDPILSKHGLSYRWRTASNVNEPICVTFVLSHRLGYSEENSLHAPRDESGNKNPIQSIGSTVNYLQRYTMKAGLGLAATADDDDGKATGGDETKTITAEQVADLKKRMEIAKLAEKKFLEYAKVQSLEDILVSQFDRACTVITNYGIKRVQANG